MDRVFLSTCGIFRLFLEQWIQALALLEDDEEDMAVPLSPESIGEGCMQNESSS